MAVTIVGNNTPTAGGVVYGDGTNYASTSAGSAGQVLQSNGSSAPSWVAPAGGAWNLISTITASGSASVSFTGLDTTYNVYVVNISNMRPATNPDTFRLLFSTNNGSSYITTALYGYAQVVTRSGISTVSGNGSTGAGFILLNNSVGTENPASGGGLSMQVTLYNPYTSQQPWVYSAAVDNGGGSSTYYSVTTAGTCATSLVNAIRFVCASGNITAGTFSLYGISK